MPELVSSSSSSSVSTGNLSLVGGLAEWSFVHSREEVGR